jgi:hypothetical protein
VCAHIHRDECICVCIYIYMGNSGIATMVGVHMHPTVGSGTYNTLVSDYNTPASNAVT